MKVGLISDTHGVFGEEFKSFFESVDVLWHCGDFGGDDAFIESIRSFKPIVAVRGNCDGQAVRNYFPEVQIFEEQGLKILMTHIAGSPSHYNYRVQALIDAHSPDVLVCGHSHILKVMYDKQYNLMYINPGASGYQGWQLERTALRFGIEGGKLVGMELLRLPNKKFNFYL